MCRYQLISVVVAAVCFLGCETGQAAHKQSIDDLLPRPEAAAAFRRAHSLIATVRYASEEELEEQITISVDADNHISVDVVAALGKPLWRQLEEGQTPTTKASHFDSMEDLRPLVERLHKMQVVLIPDETLYVHPKTTTLWITTLGGEAQFRTTSPPTEPTAYWGPNQQTNSVLLAWTDDLRVAVAEVQLAKR